MPDTLRDRRERHAPRQGPDPLARADGQQEGRLRQVRSSPRPTTSSWSPRASRSSATSASARCRTCRWRRGSAPAAAAPTSSSTAPKSKWGCYVVEVPRRGALNPEKHMYEEIYFVVEGRGTTEVWLEGDTKRHVFEWQKGSMFSIPMNAMHPHRQRHLGAGAAARRHHRAERDEPDQQRRRGLRQSVSSSATASPAPTTSTSTRTTSSPIRCAASPCGAPTSCPTSSTAICRSTTAARRLPPRRAVHDRQHVLSLDRPARERPLLQGARAHLGRRADLPQGQGLHLHLARALGVTPVEGRQGRPGQARRLRAGRHGHGGARRRALVPPALRRVARSRCG